jgi:hypothetical protein
MSFFSTYRGEIPNCIDPLNLRHCFLLAYWVYFRPTALKCYFYEANSELYRNGSGSQIFQTFKTPAYRNLFLAVLTTSLLVSVLFGLPLTLLLNRFSSVQLSLLDQIAQFSFGTSVGVIICVSFGIIFGILLGIPVGTARGVVVGTETAIAGSAGIATVIGVLSGTATQFNIAITAENLWVGISLGAVTGIIVGLGISVVIEGAIGIVVGLAFGSAAGLMGGITFSILHSLEDNPAASGLAYALAFGLVAMGMLGGGVGFVESAATVLVSGTAVGLAVGLKTYPLNGLIAGTLALVLSWRVPIYLLEFFVALFSSHQNVRRLLEWDEVLIFYLPKTQQATLELLKSNELEGLHHLSYLACNPFQRWAAQKVLKVYLNEHTHPLRFIYHTILNSPITATYVQTPVTREGWKTPDIKKLLLGEISSRWVNCTVDSLNRQLEYFVYKLTKPLRDNRPTHFTQFAALLYNLSEQEIGRDQCLDLLKKYDSYTKFGNYPDGIEIEQSFKLMMASLACNQLSDIAAQASTATDLPPIETALRPTVLTALKRLQDISTEVTTSINASSRLNQQSALLRANDNLKSLNEYVAQEVDTPAKVVISLTIQQWTDIVTEAGGELARTKIAEVKCPYKAGTPVHPPLFVGRQDILNRLKTLLTAPRPSPCALYGQRRMGKTSILQNLGKEIEQEDRQVFVDFDMQLLVTVRSTGELLYRLALRIYNKLPTAQKELLKKPCIEDFSATEVNPYFALEDFLQQLDENSDDLKVVVAIDEFELLEYLIEQKVVERDLLGVWRALLGKYSCFTMIFAGRHSLYEMSADYWHPLFGFVETISVSFLSEEAARKLITQPYPDFDIDYNQDAVDTIVDVTNGQPFLIQHICKELVFNFNRQILEGRIREKCLTIKDVEETIQLPECRKAINTHFQGIWNSEASSPSQTEILHALCWEKKLITQLVQELDLNIEEVQKTLKTLQEHDVIKEQDGYYDYAIKLMRNWVQNKESLNNSLH